MQQPRQQPQVDDNPFAYIPKTEYVPQYLGLPLDAIMQTGQVYADNLNQFELSKGYLEASTDNFLHGLDGSNKDNAERIVHDLKEKMAEIARNKNFATMGRDMLSLASQASARIAPLQEEKKKIEAYEEEIRKSNMNESDKQLHIKALRAQARNQGLQYEDGTFKITGGGFSPGVLLNNFDFDKIVGNAVSGVLRDEPGISFERALQTAMTAIRNPDIESYIERKIELENMVLEDQLKKEGYSQEDIATALKENRNKVGDSITDPIVQQVVNKLHHQLGVRDGTSSGGTGRGSQAGAKGERKGVLVEIPADIGKAEFTKFSDFTTSWEQIQANKTQMYQEAERHARRDGKGNVVRYVENGEDRTEHYQRMLMAENDRLDRMQDLYNEAVKLAIENYQIDTGKTITEKQLFKTSNFTETVNVADARIYNPTSVFPGLNSDSGVSYNFGNEKYLNAAIEEITKRQSRTQIGTAYHHNEPGEHNEPDRVFATVLNSHRDQHAYIRRDGTPDPDMKAEVIRNKDWKLEPIARFYDFDKGKHITRVAILDKDGNSTNNFTYIDTTINDLYQMDEFTRSSNVLLAGLDRVIPYDKPGKAVITKKDFPGFEDIIGDKTFEIVQFGDKTYRLKAEDGTYRDYGTHAQARKGLFDAAIKTLSDKIKAEDEEKGNTVNPFSLPRRISGTFSQRDRVESWTQRERSQSPRTRIPFSSEYENYMKESGFSTELKFLDGVEGGLRTEGYVPPAGQSGVTVGVGVDLGQQNIDQLRKWGVSNELIEKVSPYLGVKFPDSENLLAEKPLSLTQAEAIILTRGAQEYFINGIADLGIRKSDVPDEAIAVVLSLAYQHGLRGVSKGWNNVLYNIKTQNYQAAIDSIKEHPRYNEYKSRRDQEIQLLQSLITR